MKITFASLRLYGFFVTRLTNYLLLTRLFRYSVAYTMAFASTVIIARCPLHRNPTNIFAYRGDGLVSWSDNSRYGRSQCQRAHPGGLPKARLLLLPDLRLFHRRLEACHPIPLLASLQTVLHPNPHSGAIRDCRGVDDLANVYGGVPLLARAGILGSQHPRWSLPHPRRGLLLRNDASSLSHGCRDSHLACC